MNTCCKSVSIPISSTVGSSLTSMDTSMVTVPVSMVPASTCSKYTSVELWRTPSNRVLLAPTTLRSTDGGCVQGCRVILENLSMAANTPTVWQVTMEQAASRVQFVSDALVFTMNWSSPVQVDGCWLETLRKAQPKSAIKMTSLGEKLMFPMLSLAY